MQLKQKSHITAAGGTLLALLLLFLLLWFVYIDAPVATEDEGIEVAFGNIEEAGGSQAIATEAVPLPSMPAAPQVASTDPSPNDLMTQEDEESLALARQREAEEKARREADEAQRRRAEEEAAQAEAERIAQEKALAEQRRREQAAIAKADAMGSLFGNNPDGAQGSGETQGEGQRGNPVGQGTSAGNSWNLANRNIRGALPKPSEDFRQEGRVVVSIRVDAQGNVIDARVTGGTISDKATQQLAIDAARRAKFSHADQSVQTGTITYNFKFN